jgi:RimJ/RimL family protein N-acetyltransferase
MRILFETPRLVVRRIGRADADALLAIFGDRESMRLYGSGQPWTRDDVERFLATYPFGDERLISEPGIVLHKPDLAIAAYGGVGYFRRGDATADLFSS